MMTMLVQPNLMIMLKIAELYPKNIAAMAIYDEDACLWNAALMKKEADGSIGETIYTFDKYIYKSDDEALEALDRFLKFILDTVKVMAN